MHLKYSVVAPVFNESEGIEDFIQEVARVLRKLGESWELVLVNDGSSDGSREKILEAQCQFPEITLVDLSRNFGHQAAVTAAIDHATGEAVIVMDADMQDPPELIPELITAWKNGVKLYLPVVLPARKPVCGAWGLISSTGAFDMSSTFRFHRMWVCSPYWIGLRSII